MKVGTILCLTTFILGAMLSLMQMWFEPLAAEVYVKVMGTLGVIFVVVLGTTLAAREFLVNQQLRDSGHID